MEVGQMKKYLKIAAALFIVVMLSMQQELPAQAWENSISCTVLGDSIAKGYTADKANPITSYGELVTKQLAAENELSFEYNNFAKNGLDTKGLNEKVLIDENVSASLEKADLILITMGSNDLLNGFKNETQEILNSEKKIKSANQAMAQLQAGVKKNPLLILKIIDSLNKWDYSSFESQWVSAMETINSQRKADSQLIVTNIYNPVHSMNLPGTMNNVVEDIIQNMNSIIEKRAEEFDYRVVDLFQSDVVAFVQNDGLHPNQEGQQLIADMVYQEIKNPDHEADSSQSVDGSAVKGQDNTSDNSLEQGSITNDSSADNNAEQKQEKNEQVKNSQNNRIWQFTGIVVVLVLIICALTKYRKKR
jgi:lysophospholipase L1-like esterase